MISQPHQPDDGVTMGEGERVTGHWCQGCDHTEPVSEQGPASLQIMLDPLSCVKEIGYSNIIIAQ